MTVSRYKEYIIVPIKDTLRLHARISGKLLGIVSSPAELSALIRKYEQDKEIVKARIYKAGKNPVNVKIYNRIEAVYASKSGMEHKCSTACKKAGHRYVHKFRKKACIYGLPNGKILIG